MAKFQEGVYLEITRAHLGTGHTAKEQELRNYYQAQMKEDGQVRVTLLDIQGDPLPITQTVPLDEFEKRFFIQPDFFKNMKSLKEIKIERMLDKASGHMAAREFNSAEMEYNSVLKLDEENLRAKFGIGKVYLGQGDLEKAREVFEGLTQVEAVFEDKNKHVFNELGMELRRLGMFEHSVGFYCKALTFVTDDENLYFNAGRAYYEKGNYTNAANFLKKALAMNPDLRHAQRLLKDVLSRL